MPRFSANLGFLWPGLPLPEAIRAAARAGFDAVECHWPYDTDPGALRAALEQTDLPMLALNTVRGSGFGRAALPGMAAAARADIDQALDYACEIKAPQVHVLAGTAQGPAARAAFLAALEYGCTQAAARGLGLLIEPLNRYDAPGYFLQTTTQALEIINELGVPNLRLMFDCYHVQIMEGDLTRRLRACAPVLGHVQMAGVPDRGRPDRGEVNYAHIFELLAEIGWTGPVGAEYRPEGATEDSLGWMVAWRG